MRAFLADMSHEISALLDHVLGIAQATRMDELPPRRSERLSVIASSSDIPPAVRNEILDISTIEAGKLELRRSISTWVLWPIRFGRI
jgi:signal transduction histidine kinase